MASAGPDVVQEFMSITGASAEEARASLASCNNDLEQAVAAFFDSGAASTDAAMMEEDAVDEEAPAAPAAPAAALPPPLDNSADLVKSILEGAAQPQDESTPWSGGGRALGSAADDEPAPAADAAPAAAERTNPKKVRVIFWADGFTVEDVSVEEAEAARAAAAPPAPRRTGLATLGTAAERAAERPQMPKLPPLRKYEDNVKFMEDLKKGIPPVERTLTLGMLRTLTLTLTLALTRHPTRRAARDRPEHGRAARAPCGHHARRAAAR